jgi:hypothetical protein
MKKEVLEAVSGVVGVLATTLLGVGLILPSSLGQSLSEAIFAVVGVLSGPKLIGGSRSGANSFFGLAFPFFATSEGSPTSMPLAFRLLPLRSSFVAGSAEGAFDSVPVELLFILLVSRVWKDFLLSRKGVSAGEPFGDS